MPELPEVEVLARHLAPLLEGRTIRAVEIRWTRALRPTPPQEFERALRGARFLRLTRRGKYLLFTLHAARDQTEFCLLGHLGMTGRMYLQPRSAPPPRHTVVALRLGPTDFIFEDARKFGRFTLDTSPINRLGPEPFSAGFTVDYLWKALSRSGQAVKVRLLDQSLVAGVGNIYASEALFRAGIPPRRPARRLTRQHARRLRAGIRAVLRQAIHFGSTIPLDWTGRAKGDGLFYYGTAAGGVGKEWFKVYDRAGLPCPRCKSLIRQLTQAARSTYFCPQCQKC